MDKECRTIVVAKHVDGLSCCRCGGPTRPMPFMPMKKQDRHCKTKELTIQVTADTTEALERIKEITDAANECADALDKLEKVMDKFTNRSGTVELYCEGKLLSKSTVNLTADSIQGRIIKGEELGGSER
ncbi:hypothetical protein OCF13_14020 [Bacillus tropicus]|uniref:hypothetical protein n=1 Tax=Bacillus cereus group TaxID=86661 RepID=UPI001EFB0238|nr:hypothetical protein [Bacillus tropicus]MCU5423120.1 hypothetical protein [Bacillus tropicus]